MDGEAAGGKAAAFYCGKALADGVYLRNVSAAGKQLRVTSAVSDGGMSGFSKRAEPPPKRRKSTLSCSLRPETS